VDEGRLALLDSAELEKAIVGGAEWHRDTGRLPKGDPFREYPAERSGHRSKLRVGSIKPNRYHPIPFGEIKYLPSDVDHRSGTLIADDMGDLPHVASGAVEGIATFDADRLDAYEDVLSGHDWIGNIFVPKHVWTAGVVVNGCLHDALLRLETSHPMQSLLIAAMEIQGFGLTVVCSSRGSPFQRQARI
jgi:hypothetical protein